MKRREFTLEPETVAERDGITALKLATESYYVVDYTRFFASGKLMAEADAEIVRRVRNVLRYTPTDQYGRDANGIDIAAALRTLEHVKGV